VAVETGLLASLVLSTLPRPTIALVIPLTVPVNVVLPLTNNLPFKDKSSLTINW